MGTNVVVRPARISNTTARFPQINTEAEIHTVNTAVDGEQSTHRRFMRLSVSRAPKVRRRIKTKHKRKKRANPEHHQQKQPVLPADPPLRQV